MTDQKRTFHLARVALLLALAPGAGCAPALVDAGQRIALPTGDTGCREVTYDRTRFVFRCDRITYDLLQEPVRQRQIYDLLSGETLTRRHYLARAAGRSFVYKAEQVEGDRFPRRILLETHRGLLAIELGESGEIRSALVVRGESQI